MAQYIGREKEYQSEYYRKHKKRIRARQTSPEYLALRSQQQRARYASDPEYRARLAESNRRWRQRHPDRARQVTRNHRNGKKKFLADLRRGKACMVCGETHPACLDFHHRDPSQKEYLISPMWSRGYKRETILAEIAKCDVLCANCHRKEHWGHKWQSA